MIIYVLKYVSFDILYINNTKDKIHYGNIDKCTPETKMKNINLLLSNE